MARISVIKEYTEDSINKIMCHIKLENKLVLGIGDRFIIRCYSPVVTIGGGIIFDKCYNKNWKEIKKVALDFVGRDFIIECKGRANESFPLRWKLFKHWIALHAPTLALFKPQNQKECDYTIGQIESMRLNLRKNATKKPASL